MVECMTVSSRKCALEHVMCEGRIDQSYQFHFGCLFFLSRDCGNLQSLLVITLSIHSGNLHVHDRDDRVLHIEFQMSVAGQHSKCDLDRVVGSSSFEPSGS